MSAQENWLELAKCFDEKRDYVLGIIVDTRGSTYQKKGTMMLIDVEGNYTGLLSGGCLEADISLHAKEVFSSNTAKLINYDLMSDEALLWGLGLGCEGAIDILLLPINRHNNFLDFSLLVKHVLSGQEGRYIINYQEMEAISVRFYTDFDDELNIEDNSFVIPVYPPLSVLICGAGPDAQPLVTMMQSLGWQVSLLDHRKAHLSQPAFDSCHQKLVIRAEQLKPSDLVDFTNIVLMTHNLESDLAILKQALATKAIYIGLLGPAGRRDKLLHSLNLTASDVEGRVFGPIGLDIGGRGPNAIALSICAQVQQQISVHKLRHTQKPYYANGTG